MGGTFSIGAEADMLNETLKGSKADLGDANDPAFPTTDISGSKFDASVGLYYAHRRWSVGVAMQHITAPTVTLGETNEYRVKSLYNLTGAYNIPLRHTFYTITPSALLRYDGSAFRADITLRAQYAHEKRQLYFGLGYSLQHSVTGFVGAVSTALTSAILTRPTPRAWDLALANTKSPSATDLTSTSPNVERTFIGA